MSDSSTLAIVQKSEGELWANHPNVIPNSELPPKSLPPLAVPPVPNIDNDTSEDNSIANRIHTRDSICQEEQETQWIRDKKGHLKWHYLNLVKISSKQFH